MPPLMKCSRLFSSLLASVVFLAAGSASAFSQTPAQDLPDLDMLPDSVRISIVEERPDAGWKPYGIRFYSMEDWMRHEGDIAHFSVDCGTIVIGEKSEVAALMQKLQEKDAIQTEDFLEKLGIGKEIG